MMNVRDVVNEGVREYDNNYIYIYIYCSIWNAEKLEISKYLLTDEYSTKLFHYFEQCCNTVNLDGALNIIENVYKRAARETGMIKTEAKRPL